ncbi:hypothetical protein DIPPA_28856 [Diplonema papillatum]|nr:hypothetical protein DIPPA_28856 [Diplonema papillatum]
MLTRSARGPLHLDKVKKVLFSADGNVALSVGLSGWVYRYHMAVGLRDPDVQLKLATNSTIELSPSGDFAVAFGNNNNGNITVYHMSTGNVVTKFDGRQTIPDLLKTQVEVKVTTIALTDSVLACAYNQRGVVLLSRNAADNDVSLIADLHYFPRGEYSVVAVSSDESMVAGLTTLGSMVGSVVVWLRAADGTYTPRCYDGMRGNEKLGAAYLRLSADLTFAVVVCGSRAYAIDLNKEWGCITLKVPDSYGSISGLALSHAHAVVGLESGHVAIIGVRPGHADFERQCLFLSEDKSDHAAKTLLAVAVSPDGGLVHSARDHRKELRYITWDLHLQLRQNAYQLVKWWQREHGGADKDLLAAVIGFLVQPHFALRSGDLCSVRARYQGKQSMVPSIVWKPTDADGRISVVALPIMPNSGWPGKKPHVFASALFDSIPTTDITVLSDLTHATETFETCAQRKKVQEYARSLDPRTIAQIQKAAPSGTVWDPVQCQRAYRASGQSVLAAAKQLQTGTSYPPDETEVWLTAHVLSEPTDADSTASDDSDEASEPSAHYAGLTAMPSF